MAFFDLAEVKVLKEALRRVSPLFEKNLAFHTLSGRAERFIEANPALATQALLEEHRGAREIVLHILINIAHQDLMSGDEQAFGRLTLIGQHKKAVRSIALRELVAIGYLTEEKRQENETGFNEEWRERFT